MFYAITINNLLVAAVLLYATMTHRQCVSQYDNMTVNNAQ